MVHISFHPHCDLDPDKLKARVQTLIKPVLHHKEEPVHLSLLSANLPNLNIDNGDQKSMKDAYFGLTNAITLPKNEIRLSVFALNHGNSVTEYQIKNDIEGKSTAEIILKRQIPGCTHVINRPNFPKNYITASKDGTVKLWSFGQRKLQLLYVNHDHVNTNQSDYHESLKHNKTMSIKHHNSLKKPIQTLSHHSSLNKIQDKQITALCYDSTGSKLIVAYNCGQLNVFRTEISLKFDNDLNSYPISTIKLNKKAFKLMFKKDSSSLLFVCFNDDNSIHLFDLLQDAARIGFWKTESPVLDLIDNIFCQSFQSRRKWNIFRLL